MVPLIVVVVVAAAAAAAVAAAVAVAVVHLTVVAPIAERPRLHSPLFAVAAEAEAVIVADEVAAASAEGGDPV